jgi:hypothetical protein
VEALRNFLAVGNGKRAGEDAGNREKRRSCNWATHLKLHRRANVVTGKQAQPRTCSITNIAQAHETQNLEFYFIFIFIFYGIAKIYISQYFEKLYQHRYFKERQKAGCARVPNTTVLIVSVPAAVSDGGRASTL